MKLDTINPAARSESMLEAAVRRAIFESLRDSIFRVLLVALAAACIGWILAGPAVALPLSLAAGCIAAFRVARRQAGLIATAAAQPAELILGHLASSGEDFSAEIAGRDGFDLAGLTTDMAMLGEKFAAAQARARDAFAELDSERTRANLQNSAKSQFLANMSHALRTPLNAVLGYAMLLEEDARAAGNLSAVADLDRIAVAGRQLLSLINDILDLSRLDSGKATVERAVIDIAGLVESIATEAAADRRALDLQVADDVGIMLGDVAKIRQCLANLVAFARKGTENSACTGSGVPAGRIRLGVELRDTSGAAAIFTLGPIPADPVAIERMFDPAVEAASLGTSQFDGSELSLAVTRRLARLMGGDVAVASAPGGAQLILTLPLNRASRTGRVAEWKVEGVAQIVPIHGAAAGAKAARTALVIDDNVSALDLMQRWLSRLDYQVVGATSGDEGLALARDQRFDLIILDVFMPDRSGYDILKELRDDKATSDTPVILVTVDDDRARGLDAGATDFIRKPVSEAQLRSILEIYRQPVAGDILVIEDDDDAAELVIRCAEQVGFETRRAADGFEGIAMASARRPSAIVLDLAMPRCDGFNVIEALLGSESLAAVPVIILSAGEISVEDHRRIERAGYRFLAKGVLSPREIAAQLRELVA